MTEASRVCVIDDDAEVRRIACRILEPDGYEVAEFGGGPEFLASFDEAATVCVVADLRMPVMDGVEMLKRLRDTGSVVSVVIVTGHADVRTAVRLMEDGAITLLEKPYEPSELQDAVARAVEQTRRRRADQAAIEGAREALASLTADERDVLDYILVGEPNKTISSKLALSPRTVDRRRNAIFKKMKVESVPELATIMALLKMNRRPPASG